MKSNPMLFLNGKFIDENQFRIESTDRGFLLGDGLFETLRAYNGKIFGMEDHFSRLFMGAGALEIPVPMGIESLTKIITRLLDANELSDKDASIRITLTRGSGPRGLLPPSDVNPTIMVTVSLLPSLQQVPIKLHISRTTRRNEHSPLSNIKSLCYLDNVLAKMEAVENKADDAILLNTKEHVASASAGNLFLVTSNNTIITPRVEDGILPGITRKYVIEICQKYNMALLTCAITEDDLFNAKEVFITNSIIGIQSVAYINSRMVNEGVPGKTTTKISKYFQQKIKLE